jgi:hypothetical protein
MVNSQETIFCWVPVPELTMVVSSVATYLLTTCFIKQVNKHLPMYKLSTIYIPSRYLFFTYLPAIDSVEVHPQLCDNRHPVDGAVVGAGSLWQSCHKSSTWNGEAASQDPREDQSRMFVKLT